MLTLLLFGAVAVLFVRSARRVRANEAHTGAIRPGNDARRPASSSLDWKTLITPRRRRAGRLLGLGALLGCVAVVAGGVLFGVWGLVGGTAVLVAALAWAWSRGGLRVRRSPKGGSLTERERHEFDEIVARLTADD